MIDSSPPLPVERNRNPSESAVYRALCQLGIKLEVSVDRSDVVERSDRFEEGPPHGSSSDPLSELLASADQSGILLKEAPLEDLDEAIAFVREGYPLLLAQPEGTLVVVDSCTGRTLHTMVFGESVSPGTIDRQQWQQISSNEVATRIFIAKKQLDCDSVSSSPLHEHRYAHGEHISPLRRFLGLLRMDRHDVATVILFAFVAGVLTLATPLAVESLVNVVSWGTYLQPLLVLGLLLATCLGIAGILKVLQTFLVELIQRRQFVRIVSDLAHRFPRASQRSLLGEYPRELANRVFDIMTIQKATAILLLDGVSIVLTTVLGLLLLAFYHPLLLGFDIVLLISMISITWLLGRGGIRTAIEESVTKYRVAHWLQDVLASPTVFKIGGGESLAIARANQLTADYIQARKRQFQVVIRQVAFAICLQVIASTALLALGGWLVIDGQLTLGQLVASELVVTVVVGAFAKAGKSLEKFYDLMAGIDKVGYLIDIIAEPRQLLGKISNRPVEVRWGDLLFHRGASVSQVASSSIAAGSRVAIMGDDVDGQSDFARSLAGLCQPTQGIAQIGDFDSAQAAAEGSGRLVGYAGSLEIFRGTLRENIDLGRAGVGPSRVREVMAQVGLGDVVFHFSEGSQIELQTGGYPLTRSQVVQLVIARAIAAKPKLLVIDGLLDQLAFDLRQRLWSTLAAQDAPWTLAIVTNREDIIELCDSQIAVRK